MSDELLFVVLMYNNRRISMSKLITPHLYTRITGLLSVSIYNGNADEA